MLWSDSKTTFAGTILAKGGRKGGNGGFVEVSSHKHLDYKGFVDTRAPMGRMGTLLLDPENYYINATGLAPEYDPTASAIAAGFLSSQLATTNMVIATASTGNSAGDIFVQNSVIWASGNSLTLSAHGDINISSGVKIANGTEGNPGTGNLYLRADSDGDGSGTVNFGTYPYPFPGHVDYTNSTGTVSIFYNPPGETNKYLNAIPFGSNGNVLLNPNRPSQLDGLHAGQQPPATSTPYAPTWQALMPWRKTIVFNPNEDAPFAPIANFTGVFDGQGQTIANLTIKPNNSTTHNIGLFGIIGAGAVVRDVNLVNVSVTANPGVASQTVGTLAGINLGTVSGVIATGTVDGGTGRPTRRSAGSSAPTANSISAARAARSSAHTRASM